MDSQPISNCTAFEGHRRLAAGSLTEVARAVKEFIDQEKETQVLIFNDADGETVELDLRGSMQDVVRSMKKAGLTAEPQDAPPGAKPAAPRGPGRPKLGVVSREVTLLPRHWDWLNSQPGGASVTLRKLVEQARKANQGRDQVRRAQEAAYKFMDALAGNLPGFEESARALFAGDLPRFKKMAAPWPRDIRDYALKLAGPAFPAQGKGSAS